MAHSNAVQLAEHVGAALTADGATGIVTAYKFVGDGSSLTGIDATSIKDSGGTVRAQAYTAGVTVTGVLTATSLEGDGSALSNLPAGLGTAISGSGDGSLFYYTDSVLTVGSNLTLDSPTSAPVIYTQYPEVAVSSGVDLIIADGDELVTDALGIGTAGVTAISGSGGRIRADNYSSYDATDAPNFPQGGVVGAGFTFSDNVKLTIGSGGDLEIYHDGSHTQIKDSGSGGMHFWSNDYRWYNAAGSAYLMKATEALSVELYYNGARKLHTAQYGVDIDGNLYIGDSGEGKLFVGEGEDFQIKHDGSNTWIQNTTGTLYVQDDSAVILGSVTDAETYVKGVKDGNVEIFYDNDKKFETTSTGVSIAGTVTDIKGDVRDIPKNSQAGTYTLVAADAGKFIEAGNTVEIPASVFAAGNCITIVNQTAGDITITQGSGLTLYNSADGTSGSLTLSTRGIATVLYASGSTAHISGNVS